ncbi:MAG: RlmE family RNA methyltransferase [Buchnera aphidicola (Eriosoma harunire)]
MSKRRSISSSRWLIEHFKDKYVREAKKKKLRSRAWFKLNQIDLKYNLFKMGMNVIDLGCSPGGWSQYAVHKIGKNGKIIACDILPMKSINNVKFIKGNLECPIILHQLLLCCENIKINVVMSDMAPNVSGCMLIDFKNMILLNELALSISVQVLSKHGSLLLKTYQGQDFILFLKKIRSMFFNIKVYKPDSSRTRSREIFLLATGLKN